jgi:hypothetical protein
MGHSPTIADMESKEDAYRAYITKIEAELEAKAQQFGAAMQDKVTAYYKDNNYVPVDFVSGSNSDFMQASEWSLANVKKLIDAIAKSVFGGGATVPDGTDVKPLDLGKSIDELSHLEAYVAAKCFEVVSGIVESFGSSSSVSFNASYQDQPLGNGLHLFATVVCDSYKSESFFNNQEIYQYLYLYEVKYAEGEAESQSREELTQLYEDQIATFTSKVEGFLTQLQTDKITPEQYSSSVAIYTDLIATSTAALAALREKKDG